jgi:hypothetical protein
MLVAWLSQPTDVPDNCDYNAISEAAISARFPGFVPDTPLKLTRKGPVVEGHYPLPYVMPGGTTYAEVSVRDCSVVRTYLTQ